MSQLNQTRESDACVITTIQITAPCISQALELCSLLHFNYFGLSSPFTKFYATSLWWDMFCSSAFRDRSFFMEWGRGLVGFGRLSSANSMPPPLPSKFSGSPPLPNSDILLTSPPNKSNHAKHSMVLEQFATECHKTKTKVVITSILQPITTGTKQKMNQSGVEANTSN